MDALILTLPAVVSTILCLYLWFREVRRIMREQQNTVEHAEVQLQIFRDKARSAQDNPEISAVLERSKHIYLQSVENYNRTLCRLWVRPPAALMGFRKIRQP